MTLSRRWRIGLGVLVFTGLLALALTLTFTAFHGRAELARAVVALADADRYHARAILIMQLPVKVRGRERPFTQVRAQVEGDVAETENHTPEFTGIFRAETRGSGAVFFTDGNLRLLADTTAFRLDDFPVFLNPNRRLVHRWTYVPATPLSLRNGREIRQATTELLGSLRSAGKRSIAGHSYHRFSGQPTPEQVQSLAALAQRQSSGSPLFNLLARLLENNTVKTLAADVDPSGPTLRRLYVVFVKPLPDGREFERAQLQLDFTDYGKTVTIDRPPEQLTARPEIFAKMFGSGEIEPQQ